jgi:tetratricopeptide (TPR) repeat protein
MWNESISTNLRSIDVATRDSAIGEALHASDYATYAYLQRRQDGKAKAIVDRLPALAARLDLNAVKGAAPPSAGIFALSAIPARYALERRAWKEAATLQPRSSAFPYTEAMTYFARAMGASRLGDVTSARVSTDSLASIRDRLRASGEDYWAEQVGIQHLAATAWLALAEHRTPDALSNMREAVRREDLTEKAAVTPGPLSPAREQLGDMLLEIGQPAEALQAYMSSLAKDPNRFRSLYGARKAAEAVGDRAKTNQFATAIERLTRSR